MKKKPFIYVCSSLRGNIERNINRAVGYSRFVYSSGGIPMTPHVYFTAFLDDTIPEERVAGIEMGAQMLQICDELWVFGDKVSKGMASEIAVAKELGLKVRRFNDRCEPLDG